MTDPSETSDSAELSSDANPPDNPRRGLFPPGFHLRPRIVTINKVPSSVIGWAKGILAAHPITTEVDQGQPDDTESEPLTEV